MDGKRKLPEGVHRLDPDIRTMPEAAIAPFLRGWFADAADGGDPDRSLILGTKARARPAGLIYPELPAWLVPESPSGAAGAVAWFLAGFWTPESEIPVGIIDTAATALADRLGDGEVRDALIMALGIALHAGIPEPARASIRSAFSRVRKTVAIATLPDFAAAVLREHG